MIKEFKDLREDWKEVIDEKASDGCVLVEVLRELKINYKTHARFAKDNQEYHEAIEDGRMKCEAWWYQFGRENMLNKKVFDSTAWIFMMKAAFGLRETVSVDTKGSALPRREDEEELIERYKAKEKVEASVQ